ncbi:MAG: hypothetical protein LBQ60_01185 [Bacteroidales bacterium]|jgi:hypothetical protein|nr:hypothetical protein [Bacteroidales bacterium]
MQHQDCTEYLEKELDFLKILIHRFHDQKKVSNLELDIAILKAQDIYEHLLRLKLMPEPGNPEKEKQVIAKKAEVPYMEEEKVSEPVVPKVESSKIPEKQPEIKDTISSPVEKPEKKIPEIKETVPVQEKELPKEEKPASITLKTEAAILAEKFKVSQQPINETLARKNQTADLSSRLQTAPLQSIAAGIGLNERFLYIRELFHGNNDAYNEAVKKLDTATSLDEALDFIEQRFNWNMETETAQKFVHLIRRRHAGNGA